MTSTQVQKVSNLNELNFILPYLKKATIKNAPVIQDLLFFPDMSEFYFMISENTLSFVHISGHPAHTRHPVLMADGDPDLVDRILAQIKPRKPFVFRETPLHLKPTILRHYPGAVLYEEQRMELTPNRFKPFHRGTARTLTVADTQLLAKFFGAPVEAGESFLGWIRGARALMGVIENQELVAIGSSFVTLPEVWSLVSIETHPSHRKKGYGSEVTSSLVEAALREAKAVTLTVVKSNEAAIKLYEKLGFVAAQNYIWADCGANSAP